MTTVLQLVGTIAVTAAYVAALLLGVTVIVMVAMLAYGELSRPVYHTRIRTSPDERIFDEQNQKEKSNDKR